MVSANQQEKADRFAALHEGPAFVIPNPWDAGSARMLEALGFEALATTSSGFAFTLGRVDGGVSLDEMAAHVTGLDEATGLPVSADLENGYGPDPEDAARTIRRIGAAGAVGGSIEDWDRDEGRLYERQEAADRIAAAVEAARNLPFRFMLTARAENHIRGVTDLDDTIHRLWAFEEAGADVLYAPGLRTLTGRDTASHTVRISATEPRPGAYRTSAPASSNAQSRWIVSSRSVTPRM